MKTVSGTPGLFSMLKPEQSLEWSSFMCQTQHWAIPTCLNLFNLCCHLGAMLKWLFHKSSNWGSLKHSWVYRWNPPLESRKPCWSNHDRGELPLCHALSMLPCLSRQRALTEFSGLGKSNKLGWKNPLNINLGTEQWGNHQMGRFGIVHCPCLITVSCLKSSSSW